MQGDAGSAILRYGLPAFLPSSALRLVKVLPLDPALVIQAVHTPDVADAIARALERRIGGAFNLAADPPLSASDIAAALGARLVPAPRAVLRAAVAAGWNLGVQPLDPGWIDLAFAVPLMDSGRARRELGWEPRTDARTALAELVAGMKSGRGTSSAPLRPRAVAAELRDLVRAGPDLAPSPALSELQGRWVHHFGRVVAVLEGPDLVDRHGSGRPAVDPAQHRRVDLRHPALGEQPVLLLQRVRQLRVAEAGDGRAVDEGVDEPAGTAPAGPSPTAPRRNRASAPRRPSRT